MKIDPKTGEIASRFRGDRYDPQKDNTVIVDHPQSEFFGSRGKQRFFIDGKTGHVVVSNVAASQKPGDFSGKMEPPSSGQLHDVVMTMYEPADSKEPAMTIRMNNCSFDNDTFRIYTESYERDHGQIVAADQVPVQIRGVDYDFDGRGLDIHLNERDRRLQSLVVAHGERLTHGVLPTWGRASG